MPKKLLPMVEIFKRYTALEDIEKDYPGIFDPDGVKRHLHVTDTDWMLEDKGDKSGSDE